MGWHRLNIPMRDIITLIEEETHQHRVYCPTSREIAKQVIDHVIPMTMHGNYGHGLYCVDAPPETEAIVLEFLVKADFRILDLRDGKDRAVWRRAGKTHDRHALVHQGIDGVCDETGYCFFNPEAVQFTRVYAGVVDDPLEETNTNELDEFALGGLKRCTAVTVNALLQANHLPGITLSQVPINHPGVLHILAAKGLAYQPHPEDAGRSVQQFAALHRMGDWYLLTPGHAMALVHGELFDAENRGADPQRKLQAAFQVSRR